LGRPFVKSYLAGEPAADAFFAPSFLDPGARIARARAAAERRVSPELLAVLAEQQAELPESPARKANWEALAAGNAAVVVTGQQVGLFLGPLYSFYKAASAVAVARASQAESGVRCVPLFWLQTEDHDFEEIRSATIAGVDGESVRIDLPEGQSDGRSSVAYRMLPPEMAALLDATAQALDGTATADEVLRLLRQCYRPGATMASAFASLLATLFADQGLLVFNPRDARVARLASPLYRDCIENAAAIEASLHECETALDAAGFDVQVPVREQGALVFFHRDGASGPRFRIRRHPSEPAWSIAGSADRVAHQELLTLLANDPLRFSTSALLRPIVQDTLFPTVAYVAGPGEINYFGQLAPLYRRADLRPPLLVPRGRFCVVDAPSRRRLAQLGLSVGDLAAPPHKLHALIRPAVPDGVANLDELRRVVATRIEPGVEEIVRAVERSGMNLQRAAERTSKSVAHALDKLLARYARGLLDRDTVTRRRLHKVERALFPDQIPQERFYAWPSMAARLGVRGLTDMIMKRLAEAPFATEVHELHP
jgi:bacillithiol synthase